MQINSFEPDFSAEYLAACDDEKTGIFSVTFMPSSASEEENNQNSLQMANAILKKVDGLKTSINAEFLGATQIGKTFPGLAFSFNTNSAALKLHGLLLGHFAENPQQGYGISYLELK